MVFTIGLGMASDRDGFAKTTPSSASLPRREGGDLVIAVIRTGRRLGRAGPHRAIKEGDEGAQRQTSDTGPYLTTA